jgi:hypothetical protein
MTNTFPLPIPIIFRIIVSDETVGIDIELREINNASADKFVDEEPYLDQNDLDTYVKKNLRDLGSQRSHF